MMSVSDWLQPLFHGVDVHDIGQRHVMLQDTAILYFTLRGLLMVTRMSYCYHSTLVHDVLE